MTERTLPPDVGRSAPPAQEQAATFTVNQEVRLQLADGIVQNGNVLGIEGATINVAFINANGRPDFIEIGADELAAMQLPATPAADAAPQPPDTTQEIAIEPGAQIWIKKPDGTFVQAKVLTVGKGLVRVEGFDKVFRMRKELIPWQQEHASQEKPTDDGPEAAPDADQAEAIAALQALISQRYERYIRERQANPDLRLELTLADIEAIQKFHDALQRLADAQDAKTALKKHAEKLAKLLPRIEQAELSPANATTVVHLIRDTLETVFGIPVAAAATDTHADDIEEDEDDGRFNRAEKRKPPVDDEDDDLGNRKPSQVTNHEPEPESAHETDAQTAAQDPEPSPAEAAAEPEPAAPEPTEPPEPPKDSETILAEAVERYRALAETRGVKINIRLQRQESEAVGALLTTVEELLDTAKRENSGRVPYALRGIVRALRDMQKIKKDFSQPRLPTEKKAAAAAIFADAVHYLSLFAEDPERFRENEEFQIEQERVQRLRSIAEHMWQYRDILSRLEESTERKKGEAAVFSDTDIVLAPKRIEAILAVIRAGEQCIEAGLAEPLGGTPHPDTKNLKTEVPALRNLLEQYQRGELAGKPAKDFLDQLHLVYDLVTDAIDRDDLRSPEEIRTEMEDLAIEQEEGANELAAARARLRELLGDDGTNGEIARMRTRFTELTEQVKQLQQALADAEVRTGLEQGAYYADKTIVGGKEEPGLGKLYRSLTAKPEDKRTKGAKNLLAILERNYTPVLEAANALEQAEIPWSTTKKQLEDLEAEAQSLLRLFDPLDKEELEALAQKKGELHTTWLTEFDAASYLRALRDLDEQLHRDIKPLRSRRKTAQTPPAPAAVPEPGTGGEPEPAAEPEPTPTEAEPAVTTDETGETRESFIATLAERMEKDPEIKTALDALYTEWLAGPQDDPERTATLFEKHMGTLMSKTDSELYQELDGIEGALTDHAALHEILKIWFDAAAANEPELTPDEAEALRASLLAILAQDEQDTRVLSAFFDDWHRSRKTDAEAVDLFIKHGLHDEKFTTAFAETYLPSINYEDRWAQIVRAWEPIFPDKEAQRKKDDAETTQNFIDIIERNEPDKKTFQTFFELLRKTDGGPEKAYELLVDPVMQNASAELLERIAKEGAITEKSSGQSDDGYEDVDYTAEGTDYNVQRWYRIVKLLETHFPPELETTRESEPAAPTKPEPTPAGPEPDADLEGLTDAEIARINEEYLVYADVLTDEQKAVMQAYYRNPDGSIKESNRTYAETLAGILASPERKATFEHAVTEVRRIFDETMEALAFEPSKYGKSNSWIYWDIAKQTYLKDHPEKSSPEYTLGDPLTFETDRKGAYVLRSILNRHIGWEIYGYRAIPEFFNTTLDLSDPSYEEIKELLEKEPNSYGTLPSHELAELGRLIRLNLRNKANAPRHTPGADASGVPLPPPAPPEPPLDTLGEPAPPEQPILPIERKEVTDELRRLRPLLQEFLRKATALDTPTSNRTTFADAHVSPEEWKALDDFLLLTRRIFEPIAAADTQYQALIAKRKQMQEQYGDAYADFMERWDYDNALPEGVLFEDRTRESDPTTHFLLIKNDRQLHRLDDAIRTIDALATRIHEAKERPDEGTLWLESKVKDAYRLIEGDYEHLEIPQTTGAPAGEIKQGTPSVELNGREPKQELKRIKPVLKALVRREEALTANRDSIEELKIQPDEMAAIETLIRLGNRQLNILAKTIPRYRALRELRATMEEKYGRRLPEQEEGTFDVPSFGSDPMAVETEPGQEYIFIPDLRRADRNFDYAHRLETDLDRLEQSWAGAQNDPQRQSSYSLRSAIQLVYRKLSNSDPF